MALRSHPQLPRTGSDLYPQNQRSSPIDLTLDDEPHQRPGMLKRPRVDYEEEGHPARSSTSSPSAFYLSSSATTPELPIPNHLLAPSLPLSSHLHASNERHGLSNPVNGTMSALAFQPRNDIGQSSIPSTRTPNYSPHSAMEAGPSNGNHAFPQINARRLPSNQVIDLTTSPSPPPTSGNSQPSMNGQTHPLPQQPFEVRPGMLPLPPKVPVCIGQLQSTALILYPIPYLQAQGTNDYRYDPEWASVRLKYDAEAKRTNPNAEETIHIKTPGGRNDAGEITDGETFSVVEQRVATYLGPLLGRGLIRLDAKIRVGAPNLPILPLRLLVHTPNGNIPTVGAFFRQSGLLLDHPSAIWNPARVKQFHYTNPHNPPPGGHVRTFETNQGRFGYSGPGGTRWVAPTVTGKSVEVQRSQVDELFKSMIDQDNLAEYDPGPSIGTTLYPHQKKALTFILEREREIPGPNGKPPSLWQFKETERSWQHMITLKNVQSEPAEARGSLLADDMGLGKTITCVSLIASTLKTARDFAGLPLPALPRSPLNQSSAGPTPSASDFEGSVWGMPDVSDATLSRMTGKERAAFQKEKDRWETLYARARRLKVRSRATLIICPLSTVANWEDQFIEHWAGKVHVIGGAGGSCTTQTTLTLASFVIGSNKGAKEQPSQESSDTPEGTPHGSPPPLVIGDGEKRREPLRVYVYHGNARRPDPKYLADFDAVITTYATLASEFSKQGRSIAAADGDEDDDADEADSTVGAPEVDDAGHQVIQLEPPKKKGRKRKKPSGFSTGASEASSPLQSVIWFRIVLDEAHSIKETNTVASRASCELEADRRLCLTGTPVQNKLDDIYALIKFLKLAPFDDKSVWQEYIGHPVKFGQPLGVVRLQRIMKFITLRRTKESKAENGKCIISLPPRRDELRLLKFDEKERQIYDDVFKESREEFKELSNKNEVMKNYVGILQKILRLRQICDHFELVGGKDPSSGINYDELVKEIAQQGLNLARASAVFCLIRDSGTSQCVECGCELGTPADPAQAMDGMDGEPTNSGKRGRKSKNASRVPTRQNSPVVFRPVLSKCQHLFCIACFQSNIFPGWPSACDLIQRPCTVCQTTLMPSDAIEVSPEHTLSEEKSRKKPAKKEKRQKIVNVDDVHPSTKIKALLGDLVASSRVNPHSANFDPSTIEIEEVDEHGNASIGENIVKTVVFSQWTSMLDKIEDALEAAGIRYDRLDGTMKRDERSRAMDALKNDPRCEVLLVSLRAGGVGLNLTAAQRVYLMDPYWNPAVENQAVDRIHRLGQTKPVTTIKLIIENSIEARLLEVQKKKTELANMTLGTHLSKAEIQQRRLQELNQLFQQSE